jgi:hypothetical protein
MNDYQSKDLLNNEVPTDNKLPSGLNVLTILTIIWGVISMLSGAWSFFSAAKSYAEKDKTIEMMNSGQIPSFMKSIMPNMEHFEEMITKSYENRIPIMLLTIVAAGLCLWGAIEMRKRKKQGFLFYVIGSFLPFVTSALFIGFFAVTGGAAIFMLALTLLFVGLYAMQRKHLV